MRTVNAVLRRAVLFVLACGLAAALPAAAQNVARGAQLFTHLRVVPRQSRRPAAPRAAQGQPGVIADAINSVPAMSVLRGVYTNQDLADIAAYITTIFSGPPPPPDPPVGPFVPTLDYTGLWYDPAQSGWGIKIGQHPSHKIFSLFYLYEPPNKPLWISLPDGTWTSATTYTGFIYRVAGPPPTRPYDASKVLVTLVGSATFTFNSATSATLHVRDQRRHGDEDAHQIRVLMRAANFLARAIVLSLACAPALVPAVEVGAAAPEPRRSSRRIAATWSTSISGPRGACRAARRCRRSTLYSRTARAASSWSASTRT